MPPILICFLDFDGVLHPFFPLPDLSDAENAHFACVPAFEKALRQCPQARIVIASTWRNKFSLDEMRKHFSPDIAERIIGTTPRIGAGNGDGGRQVEAEAWLEENNMVGTAWIGIDDFPDLYRPGAAVVVCHDGFRERETVHLLEAAQDPKAYAAKYPVRGPSGEQKIIIVGSPR